MQNQGLGLRWLFFLFLILPAAIQGQNRASADRLLSKARSAWEQRDYGKAGTLAAQILKKRPAHPEALLLMADICHEQDSVAAEVSYLRRAAAAGKEGALLDYRLGEACFRIASYRESLDYLDRFLQVTAGGNLRLKALLLRSNAAFADSAVKNPLQFEPLPLGENINSPADEYWPALTIDGNQLLFTRLMPGSGAATFRQEDFYLSRHDSTGWQPAIPLADLNTPMNEGALSVSADGKLLFYTLCNHPAGFGSCDIWFSRNIAGKWSPPVNAGEVINTAGWEGQPSFSAFGGHLFFSSTRPGGKGKKDLWVVTLKGWDPSGLPRWEVPVNLGDSVNTPGDEISPFIHPNGKDLYFASDTWPGFGGFDLFRTQWEPDHSFTSPANLGFPLNSPGNEQGLIIDRTGKTGYFSSNLVKGGNMDLFAFETDERIRPSAVTYLRGRVVNAVSRQPVSAAVTISAAGEEPFPSITLQADKGGVFLVTLPPGKELLFSVQEPGFLFYSERFQFRDASSLASPLEREIALEPAVPGKTIDLYNIFFATNEFAVLPASEPELQLLLGFLRQNPSLRVEIGGHTDNIGSDAFNLTLSEKRAASVRQYLLLQGIAAERLSSKGYGMDQPVTPNDSEEGRSRNRRTTLRIVQ